MRRLLIIVPVVAILTLVSGFARPQAESNGTRALWLWNPDPMLTDASARAAFFRFLEAERIGTVWAQVGTERGPGPSRQLTHRAEWRTLAADAHGRHVRIEALDGDPSWALAAYHRAPLDVVDAVLAFNREAAPIQHLDGVHLDIEPYLLIPWRYRLAREQLLREYLTLLTTAQQRLYEVPGMQFGVDIPYWWGATDDKTGRPIADVTFQGTRKAANEHLIDRLDNVGIMNYRNVAEGGDGLISHGADLLAYADAAGHARIWMGVETSREAPVPVWFAVGLPSAEADRVLQGPSSPIGRDNRIDGFRVRLFDDGFNTHVGLSMADLDPGALPPAFTAALATLARTFGVLNGPGPADRGAVAEARTLRAFASNREWENAHAMPIPDASTRQRWPGIVVTSVMLPKLTFQGVQPDTMRRELALADAAFSKYRSYAGFAIHHYGSYLKLMGGSALPAGPPYEIGIR